MARLMFGESYEERFLGRIWSWNLPKVAKAEKKNHSMMLIRLEKPLFKKWAEKGWFIVPTWVSGELRLPLDPKVLRSATVKSDLKKMRDHKLEFEITQEPSQFERFYREMHIPYMKEIHGEAAYIEPYDSIKSRLRNSELLLVKKDGEYISGTIIVYEGSRTLLWLLGVRNGDREYLKVGAIIGIYYPSFDRAVARGCKRVELGWSRAFLNDGPLRYKRKLAMQITGSSGKAIALKVISFDAATRSFLRNNPFIAESAEGLGGAVFVDADEPLDEAAISRLNKDYFHAGLSGLSIYRIPENGSSEANDSSRQFVEPVHVGAEAPAMCAPETT